MKNKIKILQKEQYQWNQNWQHPIAHSDINLVISEFRDIESIHGKINPQLVLESSKNKKSVLHDYFEWDNEKAANHYRIAQASLLLRQVQVKIIKDGSPFFVRAYEVVKRDNLNNNSLYNKYNSFSGIDVNNIVRYIVSDLNRLKDKISQFSQFSQAIEYINKAISELQKDEVPLISSTVLPISETENITADLVSASR